ncbi:MAG: radical SAM protein [Kiritimatiellae bacterium]|nr:radical SAM protein [Kiritimatiellia bacterium]
MTPIHKYLFGPVPSRRFGRSLGVDLPPLKTCTLDCVFCQLGHTSHKTMERKEYAPIPEVESELAHWLQDGGKADYITLSGSGEPTLHSGFGTILQFIKKEMPFPSVLLSNGTLFWLPEVRTAACAADIVKLSLSAWDMDSFRRVNRPHEDLSFDRCVEGLRDFRKEFRGNLWLEVFLIEGINSLAEDVKKIARIAESIAPDEIHLNTAVRPPAEQSVSSVDRGTMEELAGLFQPRATIIAGFPTRCGANIEANEDRILDMLRRRPCTALQIQEAFGMHVNEVSKYVGDLVRARRIRPEWRGGEIYFKACDGKGNER